MATCRWLGAGVHALFRHGGARQSWDVHPRPKKRAGVHAGMEATGVGSSPRRSLASTRAGRRSGWKPASSSGSGKLPFGTRRRADRSPERRSRQDAGVVRATSFEVTRKSQLLGLLGGLLGLQGAGAAPGLASMLDLNSDINPLDDIMRIVKNSLTVKSQ